MRNFTTLILTLLLTLCGATTAQAQTFVTYAEQSTPANEIVTGNYVIKTKWKDNDPRWLCVNSSSHISFCEALDEASLKNVWRVEKKDDGSFYMMNLGTATYIKLGGSLAVDNSNGNGGADLTLTNNKSAATYLSAHEGQTEGSTTKIDDNAFSIAADVSTATGIRQHFHIYNDSYYSQATISSWGSTNGSEKFSSSQTFVQFAFYKADLDYSLINGAPALGESNLYYIQGQNGYYLSTQENGQYTNDQNSARTFFVTKTDDNRYELWTNNGNNHMTISDQPWFMQKNDEDGYKVYFSINPVSGTDYFTINNLNGTTLQYMLNGTSNKVGKGTDPTAENARWKFVPANEAATEAASLTANVQTGDAVHGNVTTFSASYPVAIPNGYKAYTATYEASSNVINVTELAGKVIPANTGVLLRGDVNASLSIKPTMQTGTAVTDNVLTAVGDADKTFSSSDDKIYLLGKSTDGTLCFRHMSTSGTQTIGKHKAYINLSGVSNENLATLRIRFDGEATGINDATMTQQGADNSVFDLSGRRVNRPTHGIYIKGGKKVIF